MCDPRRVFSLDPIEGYEPPVLSGHRDGIIGIFFTGPATQKAAIVRTAPLLHPVAFA